MIYILLIYLILIFIVTLSITKDLFHPSNILIESYILAVFCAILNIDKWNIILSNQTVLLILLGIISFAIPSLFLCIIYKRKNKINKYNSTNESISQIKIKKANYYILFIIQIIIFLLYTFTILKIIKSFSSNFFTAISLYRFNSSFDNEASLPFIIKQFYKLSKAIIYVLTYIEIYNIIVSYKSNLKIKIKKSFIIMVVVYFIEVFL